MEREKKKQYVCSNCHRRGIGYVIQEYIPDGINKWRDKETICPNGWNEIKAGILCSTYHLCDMCSCDSSLEGKFFEISRKTRLRNFILLIITLAIMLGIFFGVTSVAEALQGGKSVKQSSLKTEKQKISYALGAHYGNIAHYQLVTKDSLDVNIDAFLNAFESRYKLDSSNYLMSDSDCSKALNDLSKKMKKKS